MNQRIKGSISRGPENGGFGKRVTEVDRLREVTHKTAEYAPANRVHFRSRLLQRSLGRSAVDAFDLVWSPPRLKHGLSNSSALGMLGCLNEASFDVKSSLSLCVHWFLRGNVCCEESFATRYKLYTISCRVFSVVSRVG